MTDPYETLGLPKSATAAEIKAQFKKLARKHHPDLHPDDAGAESRFKAISAANDLLGDPEKRRRFDAGEIDAAGAERPPSPAIATSPTGLVQASMQRRTASRAAKIWRSSCGRRSPAGRAGSASEARRAERTSAMCFQSISSMRRTGRRAP